MFRFRNLYFALAALLGGLGSLTSLGAQTISGSIVGSVVDPSNLPVAGASMVLRQLNLGGERQMRTDARGDFVFSNLVAGEYTLTGEASGFKMVERKGLMLSASLKLSVGTLVLEVGSVAEKITVTEQGAALQTASSERSGVVTSSQVQDLLSKSRNVMSLLQLLPGVVDTNPDVDTLARTWSVAVQGGRYNTNSLSVDGMTLNSWGLGNATDVAVSQDSIAEVRVLTGNFQAEFGRKSGANITLVSKTGSQNFHGLGSYFKRHEEFNATDFFRNRTGQKKPRYRYNTWTYNIGGPVYIPNKFNRNKDKLFFFWNQEFWPLQSAVVGSVTTPTALERTGDFSQTVDLNRALIPIKDPTNGLPFPGNVVPANRLNASGVSLLKMFPLPNFLDFNTSKGAYNYNFTTPVSKPTRMETLRLDYNINSNNRISGSYYHYISAQQGAMGLDTSSANWPQMSVGYSFMGQTFLGRYTRILSPSFINELNVGFTRRPQGNTYTQDQLSLSQRTTVGFTAGQFTPENNTLNLIPNATFGGVPTAANLFLEGRFPFYQNGYVPSATDTLTKTQGAHTLKAGITADLLFHKATVAGAFPYGNLDFTRNTVNPLDTNYAYSNAALGVFNTYQESSVRPIQHWRQRSVEWFAQDSWKATRRLTLEYGIRFCWLSPMYDAYGFESAFSYSKFDPSKQVSLLQPAIVNGVRVAVNPATGATSPAATIGAIAPGTGTAWNGMLATDQNPGTPAGLFNHRGPQLAPRFGFAYDVFGNGKTAVRGGFGMYYNEPGYNAGFINFGLLPPLVVTPTVYYGNLSTLLSSAGATFPQAVYASDMNSKIPSVMDITVSVQQKLPFDTLLDVGYSGSLARNLFWNRETDAVPLGRRFDPAYKDPTTGSALSTAFLTPIRGYTSIPIAEAAGSSNYHSLQVSVNRRFATRLQFGVSWTWSKAMDFTDDDTSLIPSPLSPRSWDYGMATFDRTHVLKANVIWDLPGTSSRNPVVKAVLNDWHLSAIPSFVSGAPLGITWSSTAGVDITGTPSQTARIVVTGNPVMPKSERTFYTNFRTDVFQLPAVGTFGNAARTLIRGPGINNWDTGLFKMFRVREFARLQFRWEMYNALNHTQFSTLDTGARFDANGNQVNASFGQFTASRSPRADNKKLTA